MESTESDISEVGQNGTFFAIIITILLFFLLSTIFIYSHSSNDTSLRVDKIEQPVEEVTTKDIFDSLNTE